MIIIRLMGGLGNQLQQYALYQKFISMGKEAYLDVTWFRSDNQKGMNAPRTCELDLFEKADYKAADTQQIHKLLGPRDMTACETEDKHRAKGKLATGGIPRAKRLELQHKIGRGLQKLHVIPDCFYEEKQMYDPLIFDRQNAYFQGYWAAEKYYEDIMPTLREKLEFTNINAENREFADKISAVIKSGRHTCSVHIRRGDYLDPENAATFGGIATESYYRTAFDYVNEKYSDTEFYIFSDDREYVQEKYGADPRCHFADINHGPDARFDIYLMSLCQSHICANSTFSFWGARLDPHHEEPQTICIRPSIHKNSQVFVPEQMHGLWRGWVLIDPEGNIR